jgi:hypothetical protein
MTRTIFAAALAACLAAVPLAAHHSYAGFDQTRTLVEARVESLRIENPHTLIDMKARDGQRYRIIFVAASALGRVFVNGAEGMTSRIRVGDMLLVSGRLKRGDDVIEVVAAQIDDAAGTPIHPINRPALTRPPGPGPSWPLETSSK